MMIVSRNNGFGFPVVVQIPRIKNPIPLFIVFRALGIIPDKDICNIICLSLKDSKLKKLIYSLQGSIVDSNKVLSEEAAIEYIMNCLLYTSPSPRDQRGSRMPSSA